MASISSVGSFSLPTEQPIRRQAERSITATENELSSKQKQINEKTIDQQTLNQKTLNQKTLNQKTRDQQSSGSSEPIKEAPLEKKQSLENEEQQKFEAAQQEAQRAEFTQQAGIVRETEPNDVRPPSSTFEQSQNTNQELTPVILMRDNSSSENTAINTFNQFQNIDAPPRQGQALNKFV